MAWLNYSFVNSGSRLGRSGHLLNIERLINSHSEELSFAVSADGVGGDSPVRYRFSPACQSSLCSWLLWDLSLSLSPRPMMNPELGGSPGVHIYNERVPG